MQGKLRKRDTLDPVAPFIDHEGYIKFIQMEEEDFGRVLAKQEQELNNE